MARNVETLPEGTRITDYMGIGVVAKTFPFRTVSNILDRTRRKNTRKRDLPADIMVYYIIITALYARTSSRELMRCLLEGIQWIVSPSFSIKVAGKSGISQARARLGLEPVRQLHDEVVRPIAKPSTSRAWYRGWRLVSLDTATLAVGDDPSNVKTFGRRQGGRERDSRPQIRFVSLVEYGTHVLFGSQMGPHGLEELRLAEGVLPNLREGMLCFASQRFFDFGLWRKARETGADLLWRGHKHLCIRHGERLADGSYLSRLYPHEREIGPDREGEVVRVIIYPAEEAAQGDTLLVTSILDHESAHADHLIELYNERHHVEMALDKLKSYMNGNKISLRSKKPDLVRQEFYGMMMAHFAIRSLIHEAVSGEGDVTGRLFPFISEAIITGALDDDND